MKSNFYLLLTLSASLMAFQDDDFKVEQEYIRIKQDGKDVTFFGRAKLTSKDYMIEADTISYEETEGAKKITCKGNCIAVPTGANYTLFADRITIDTKNNDWDSKNAVVVTKTKSIKTPYRYVYAKQIIKSGDKLVFKKIKITACEYNLPDYYILASTGETVIKNNKLDLDTTPVDLNNVSVRLYGVPIFYLPYFRYTKDQDAILDSIRFGRNTRFGNFFYLTWGIDVGNNNSYHGQVKLQTDHRQFRGYAGGLDHEWNYADHFGYIDTYLMRDKGPNLSNDFDKKFASLDIQDRYRVRTFNRFTFDDFRAEIESSKLSDRFLLEDIFQKEFKTGKEQETTVYGRYLGSNTASTFQFKSRINEFQTQLEKLPETTLYVSDIKFFDYLNYSNRISVSNLRNHFDDDLLLDDQQSWRMHAQNELSYNTNISVFNTSVFLNNSWLYYEQDIDENQQYRDLTSIGGDISFALRRKYDGFIHRVDFSIGTEDLFIENGSNDELLRFTEEEGLTQFWESSVQMKHSFYSREKENLLYKFLQLDFELEYYPRSKRDTVSFNETNFLYPFDWLAVYPLPGEQLEERKFSNLFWSVEFLPKDYIELRGNGEYNTRELREDIRQLGLVLKLHERFSVNLLEYKQVNTTDSVTLGFWTKLAEKWGVGYEVTKDLESDRFVRRQITFDRELHDFIFRVFLIRNPTRDENLFLFSLFPKFLKKDLQLGNLNTLQ
ncbi:MAG: hypothetical protein HY606_04835 [Planctomycetes bacterium]|nr:hypothetical protein [Planctomycetota bacterium]